MRTTLTIDDGLATRLKEEAHRSALSFKQVVNDTLRAGLAAQRRSSAKRYRLKPASLGGVVPRVNLDKALRLAASMEDEGIAHKLELRK